MRFASSNRGLGPVTLHNDCLLHILLDGLVRGVEGSERRILEFISIGKWCSPPPLVEQDHLLPHLDGRQQDRASITVVWLELMREVAERKKRGANVGEPEGSEEEEKSGGEFTELQKLRAGASGKRLMEFSRSNICLSHSVPLCLLIKHRASNFFYADVVQ
jgi:hypothetical protein